MNLAPDIFGYLEAYAPCSEIDVIGGLKHLNGSAIHAEIAKMVRAGDIVSTKSGDLSLPEPSGENDAAWRNQELAPITRILAYLNANGPAPRNTIFFQVPGIKNLEQVLHDAVAEELIHTTGTGTFAVGVNPKKRAGSPKSFNNWTARDGGIRSPGPRKATGAEAGAILGALEGRSLSTESLREYTNLGISDNEFLEALESLKRDFRILRDYETMLWHLPDGVAPSVRKPGEPKNAPSRAKSKATVIHSTKDSVLAVFIDGKKITRQELTELFPDVDRRTINYALTGLVESGELVRVGHGVYKKAGSSINPKAALDSESPAAPMVAPPAVPDIEPKEEPEMPETKHDEDDNVVELHASEASDTEGHETTYTIDVAGLYVHIAGDAGPANAAIKGVLASLEDM